jgi:3-methyladenine DNA glycosylase AlkD
MERTEITDSAVQNIRQKLFALRDEKFGEFQKKLMPTVDPETVIGVRTPELRKLARILANTEEGEAFLQCLPHLYFEENNLHAFLLEQIRDYGQAAEAVERFLPFVDNWATCDQLSPKVLGKHLPELLEKIRVWIVSPETYTVRFAVGMLMRYYLGEAFLPEYPEMVAEVRSEEYYVNMMAAWYFATALAKQYETVLPYLEQDRLEKWTHNQAIRKALESRRITVEQKEYLRTLKRK